MASSDRFKFHVGDRVKDRQTREEGRVIDIRALPDGVLFVTVAYFVGTAIRRRFEFPMRPGQAAGLPVEKILTTAGEASSRFITSPTQGGQVSAVAVERARLNLPVDRAEKSLTRRMTDREIIERARDAAREALATPAIIAEEAAPRIARLQALERKLELRHHEERQLLSYLTGGGRRKLQQVIKNGQIVEEVVWEGSYLSDALFNRRQAAGDAQRQLNRLERVLRGTRLGAGGIHGDHFLSKYRTHFGGRSIETFETAFDVLEFARAQIANTPAHERSSQWRYRYGQIIAEAVTERRMGFGQGGPGLTRIRELREESQQIYREFGVDPEAAAFSLVLDAEGIREGITDRGQLYQSDARIGIEWDVPRQGIDPEVFRRRKNIGIRIVTQVERNLDPAQLFGAELVRVRGRLYQPRNVSIGGPQLAPKAIQLSPVQANLGLFAGFDFGNEFDHAELLDNLAAAQTTSFNPVRGASPAAVAGFENTRVTLRGGLLGERSANATVRAEFVRAFLTGGFQNAENRFGFLHQMLLGHPAPPTITPEVRSEIQAELAKLGISESRFFEAARRSEEQFFRGLRAATPREELARLERDASQRVRALATPEDALGIAFQHATSDMEGFVQGLGDLSGPVTIEELRERIQRTAWEKALVEIRRPGEEIHAANRTSLTDAEGNPTFRTEQRLSTGQSPGMTTMREVRDDFGMYAEYRKRMGSAEAFEEAFGALSTHPERGAIQLQQAEAIATLFTTKGRKRDALRRMRAFAEATLGLQVFDELPVEYQSAFNEWQTLRNQAHTLRQQGASPDEIAVVRSLEVEARSRLEALKIAEVNTRARQGFVEQVLDAEGTGISTANNAITRANEASVVRQFNAILSQANATGLGGPLQNVPHELVPLSEGGFGIRLYSQANRRGDAWIYRAAGENAGVASLLKNPNVQVGLGEPGDLSFTATDFKSLAQAGAIETISDPGRAAKVLEQTAAHETRIAAESVEQARRASRDASILGTANRGTRQLPLYRLKNGQVIGYTAENVASCETMRRNVRDLLANQRSFIGLDIETSIETGQVQNVHASRWEWSNGQLVRTGERLDLAIPEFFEKHEGMDPAGRVQSLRQTVKSEQPISEELRTISRFGHNVAIDEVVASEREMLERLGRFVGSGQDLIVGHNIGFDIGTALERSRQLGLTHETVPALRRAADQMADTIVAAQVALPEQTHFSLEDLIQNLRGSAAVKEAHVGSSDIEWTAELLQRIQARGRGTAEAFASAERFAVPEGRFLWDQRAGRAYELLGVVDSEAARARLARELGQDVSVPLGMIVRPFDFTTRRPRGAEQVLPFFSPAHFARGIRNMQIGTLEETAARMSERVTDLARKRVRRVTNEVVGGRQVAFENFLKERERYNLVQASEQGEGALSTAMQDLAQRHLQTDSPALRRIYSDVSNWRYNEQYFGDSRIREQLKLQSNFWAEAEAHQPVIEWLERHMARGGRREANVAWTEYLNRISEVFPWASIEGTQVRPEAQKVSFNFEALGKNPVGIRTGSREMVQEDLNQVARRLASTIHSQDPNTIRGLLASESAEIQSQVLALLRLPANKMRGAELPATLQQFLWDRHMLPALQAGGTAAVENVGQGLFQLQGTTVAQAIEELTSGGQAAAQKYVASLTDPLAARQIDPERLWSLQSEMMATSPAEWARSVEGRNSVAAETAATVLFQRRHGVPDLTGRNLEEVLSDLTRRSGTGESIALQIDNLKRAARRMEWSEVQQLRSRLETINPEWVQQVLPWWNKETPLVRTGRVAAQEIAGAADEALPTVTRAFQAGRLNTRSIETAEWLFERRATARVLGMIALGATAILGTVSAFTPPQGPTENTEQTEAQGMASTEGEVARRRARQVREIPAHHAVAVTILGEDPLGMDHAELSQSVHEVMTSFINQKLEHRTQVDDRRSKIDRQYMDSLAARLMTV